MPKARGFRSSTAKARRGLPKHLRPSPKIRLKPRVSLEIPTNVPELRSRPRSVFVPRRRVKKEEKQEDKRRHLRKAFSSPTREMLEQAEKKAKQTAAITPRSRQEAA